MTLVCTPDLGVALPPEGLPYPLLKERAEAACSTIDLLLGAGLDPQLLIPKPEDKDVAQSVVEAFAKDENQASQSLTTNKISTMTPASLLLVKGVLDEFGHAVVEKATHIRHLVTNKLILESENPDPKVRIRALELLGKISDVGLFSERTEVTITHQSTDELKQSLRDKLNKLRAKMDVVDVEVVQPVQTINLDEELGLPAPQAPQNLTSEGQNDPENPPETSNLTSKGQKTPEDGGEN